MRRSALIAPTLALVMASVVACSSETPGTPTTSGAGPTSDSATPSTSKPPKTTKTSAENPVADLQPCELISSAAAKTLGITGAPKEDDLAGTRICQWRVDKGSIADSYTLGVGIFDDLGIKDVVANGEVKKLTVGNREAVQYFGASGGTCSIALMVTEKSRVDVQASGRTGEKLCAPALEAAKLVEPELP